MAIARPVAHSGCLHPDPLAPRLTGASGPRVGRTRARRVLPRLRGPHLETTARDRSHPREGVPLERLHLRL